MDRIDYEEMVELWTANEDNDDPPRHAEIMWGGRVASLPLWEAIKTVMEEWAPGSRRRSSAQIVRNEEPYFLDIAEIEAIYLRPDFPHG